MMVSTTRRMASPHLGIEGGLSFRLHIYPPPLCMGYFISAGKKTRTTEKTNIFEWQSGVNKQR